jgi:hypothetical protein
MSEPRAQRTLVKSPPELWAEISDAGTLARHLGEFGDIRITRLEAETTVVWEGDRACGTVELEASGWGTKVTITASAVAEEAPTTAPPPAAEQPAAVEEEPATEEAPEPAGVAQPRASVPPPGFVEAPQAAAAPRKRGFFARLLGRKDPVVLEPPVAIAVPAEPVPEPEPVAVETPAVEAPPVEEPELEGEIAVTAAAMDAEQVEAVLVGVLDDLGSAHHRPFSRG